MRKSRFRPGDVFLVPLGEDKFAPGIITHVGPPPLMFATFGIANATCDLTADQALNTILRSPKWQPFIGKLGFTKGEWKVIGNALLPDSLQRFPLFRAGDPAGPMKFDERTFKPICTIPGRDFEGTVEKEVAGYIAVEKYLARLIAKRTAG